MPRVIANDTAAELDASFKHPALLLELEFSGAPALTLWTGNYDLPYDGKAWLGNGWLAGINTIEEDDEERATGLEVTLLNHPALHALFLTNARQGLFGRLWLAFMDSSEALTTPLLVFDGDFDRAVFEDGGSTGSIKAYYESELIVLDRPHEHRYNHPNQQALFAGDKGFEFVEKLKEWNGYWGKPEKAKKKERNERAKEKNKEGGKRR